VRTSVTFVNRIRVVGMSGRQLDNKCPQDSRCLGSVVP